MELFWLLKREIEEPLKPLLIFLLLSGITNGLLIGIINNAAEYVSNSEINGESFLLFSLGVLIFLISKKYVLDRSSLIVESAICRLRMRIADKIRHTELATLEAVGTSPLYARLTQDATYISNVATNVISSTQSAIMIFFTILYIGYLSLWSFVMIIAAIGVGMGYYFLRSSSFMQMWYETSRKETAFFDTLSNILKGFKEVKINRSKNEGVFNNYREVNISLRDYRVELSYAYNVLLIFSQSFFYLILGSVLFVIPQIHAEHSADIIKVTAAIFSIMGPFEGIMTSMQLFDNASSATRNIVELEEQLEAELSKNKLSYHYQNLPIAYKALPCKDNLHLRNLSYSYPPTKEHDHVFTVGPINLTFKKGELIFITGGNGSGKSTFLKLLTGLYPPETGEIVLDTNLPGVEETLVTPENYQQYRNLFSTIFTDFHLFDKLYGVENVNVTVVNKLLQNMELSANKTVFKDGGFTNLHLSSGQKKRLALTTSIIEDKPIYIFDEVASDLDPDFRDKYYYELLQELKGRNKTVIVVSHDRHYWTVPDRLLEMDNGVIRELSKEEINTLLALNH